MTAPVLALLTLIAVQAAPSPLVANGDTAEASRLHIGGTGIRCARLPCPGRALFEPQSPDGHATRGHMLYVDVDGSKPPPPMNGDPTDLAAIRTAWEDRQCLAIDGRLIPGEEDRPVLRVDRIVGSCRKP
ncbi:hypothetical protein ACBY01_15675 [Sphingomonas sp. ac-8]|uniref:hypothetical protein n=1 Tax=Sphingomonas sp. ac-8 TaxID=3242977 RepID=UPI003A81329A